MLYIKLCCYSVAKSHPALCNPMNYSTPSFLHYLLESAQTHIYWVLSRWCHPTVSSSVAPFPSCPQSFPPLGSFPVSWLFTSGGQSIGVSTSVLPMNSQGWFPLGLTGMISLQSKGLSRVFSNTTIQKHQTLDHQVLLFSLYPPNRGRAGQKTRLQIKDAQLILFIPTETHIYINTHMVCYPCASTHTHTHTHTHTKDNPYKLPPEDLNQTEIFSVLNEPTNTAWMPLMVTVERKKSSLTFHIYIWSKYIHCIGKARGNRHGRVGGCRIYLPPPSHLMNTSIIHLHVEQFSVEMDWRLTERPLCNQG